MLRKSRRSHYVSLVVPVYRQEKTILKNLRQLKKVLDEIRYDYEMIVIVDGFVDKSWQRVTRAKIPKVHCYGYEDNRGKSYAIRLGMQKAKGDYIMFIDSGLEIDPNGISMLIEHMEWYKADIIVGSKRHPASLIKYNWQRKILSVGYFWLVKILFGVKVKDTQAGIKIYKRNVLKKVLPRLVEKRFAGDLEILVVASILGYTRTYEAPIKLNYHLTNLSSAANLRSIEGIMLDTLAIFYRKNILRYYHQVHKRFVYPNKIYSYSFKS